ncbi:MAG: 50S ribosomal protein L7/L12 [Clostridiales bacterium]|nr:50S ribosomal protein L7/L12 [Clostridiales bacterium]
MKKNSKLMVPLMALAMILSLCACSGKNAEGSAVSTGNLAASPAAVAEKTEFDVVLVGVDDASKIQLIKVVREITGMGLADAKAAVDTAEDIPQPLKEAVSKEEAEELKKKIEEAGGKVELK